MRHCPAPPAVSHTRRGRARVQAAQVVRLIVHRLEHPRGRPLQLPPELRQEFHPENRAGAQGWGSPLRRHRHSLHRPWHAVFHRTGPHHNRTTTITTSSSRASNQVSRRRPDHLRQRRQRRHKQVGLRSKYHHNKRRQRCSSSSSSTRHAPSMACLRSNCRRSSNSNTTPCTIKASTNTRRWQACRRCCINSNMVARLWWCRRVWRRRR